MSQIRNHINILIHTILELVKFLSAFLSLFYIVYAIIFRTIFFLLPSTPDIEKDIFEMSDIKFNLLFVFISLAVSWIISYKQKKVSLVNPFKFDKEELVGLFVTSLLLAYFFTRSFSLLSTASNNNLTTAALTVFFLYFLAQIIEFYNYYYPELHISTFKKYSANIFSRQNFTFFKGSFYLVTIAILLGGYAIISSWIIYNQSKQYQKVLKEDLFIVRVAPPKTTLAYRVQLQGYNFGQIPNERHKLFSTYGPVEAELWTNNSIDFVVPLSWKEGNVDLWIERPSLRDETRMISSNVTKFTVLDRWDFFPTANENIFARGFKKLLRVVYLDYWNSIVSKFTFLP